MKRTMIICVALAVACLSGPVSNTSAKEVRQTPQKISKPLEYQGYSEREYKGYKKSSQYVTMSDGVKLAVDIFLPADGPERKSFPVVFTYTPYSRAFVDLRNGPAHKIFRKIAFKNVSQVMDESRSEIARTLLAYGYAYVIADMRGTGASYGWKLDFMPKIGEDGAEVVNWIAKQPWSDGNVGMVGGSYLGFSQMVTAGHAPPALKCIIPMVIPLEGYDGEAYPGGIYLSGFMQVYSGGLSKLNLNYYKFSILKALTSSDIQAFSLPAAPVVDEDGDGRLDDEIPMDINHNGTFLDDYKYPDDQNDPPRYKDGLPRKHIYYLATKEHEKNFDYNKWASQGKFIDGNGPEPFNNMTAYDLSPAAGVPGIMKSGIAVYNMGGWFDPFVRGTTELFGTMRATNPSKMLIAPVYHSGGGPFVKYLGIDHKAVMEMLSTEIVRFFDRYLKKIENGIDKEPPIYIYVANGAGWRFENEWPLPRQVKTQYFFNPANNLSKTTGDDGSDKYVADFSHDSRYGKNLGNRWLSAMGLAPNALPYRTQKDKQCLTYTTAPIENDMEITGHPIVDLWVSSTAEDGDFYVYLEDVDEKGQALLISEGVLRAGFAALQNNNDMIFGGKLGINVLPKLPWHGFMKNQYNDKIFAGGNIVNLHFDLKPISWVVRKNHRIRVSIASADWPTFGLHPNLSPSNRPDDPKNIVPTITVYRDAKHSSKIELPVIPQ